MLREPRSFDNQKRILIETRRDSFFSFASPKKKKLAYTHTNSATFNHNATPVIAITISHRDHPNRPTDISYAIAFSPPRKPTESTYIFGASCRSKSRLSPCYHLV